MASPEIRLVLLNTSGAVIATAAATATTFDRNWIDQANEPGTGQLLLQNNDQLLNVIGDDTIVACYLDDLWCFDWIIQHRKRIRIAPTEEEGQTALITGKGRASILERAVVYPEGGAGRPQTPDSRPFDWSSIDYNDTGWAFAAIIQQALATTGPWPFHPEGYPDPLAGWIWPGGYIPASTPTGAAYFRKVVTLPEPGDSPTKRYSIYATGDNAIRVLIDGEEVIGDHTDVMWATMRQTFVDLAGGAHTIAIEGYNDWGPAGVLMSLYEVTNGGADLGAVYARTDASWKCLGYPTVTPGMTPGEVMRVLLSEAQARGVFTSSGVGLTTVTTDFTDTLDSEGLPWAGGASIAVPVGTDYLSVLRQLSEVEVDWEFSRSPGTGAPVLRLFAGPGADNPTILKAGADRGPGLPPDGNLLGLEHDIDTESLANVLLSRYRGTVIDQIGWREDTSAGSVATYGRRERFLSAGPQPADYVAKLADGLFAAQDTPNVAVTAAVEIRPDLAAQYRATPYLDYLIGQWIHAPNDAGVSTRYRVKGFTITEDTAGNVSATPELSTIATEFEERLQRWLKRMAPGSLYGIVFNAAPVLPPVLFDQVIDIPSGLDSAIDVSDVPPDTGQGLGWDGDEWVPMDFGGFSGGGGIPQFSFPGQVGVQSSVKHRVIGGGGVTTVSVLAAQAGLTSTTFQVRVGGAMVGQFTLAANVNDFEFPWSHTFAAGAIVDTRITSPGSGVRGLGIQLY